MEHFSLFNQSIAKIGIGTWGIGGKREADTSRDAESIEAIRTGIEHGLNHIDTAEVYGAGHAEELVGEAIAPYKRDRLFLTTKVSGDNLSYRAVHAAARASLERLNTEYIDLYLIHWPNPTIPIEQTMRALTELTGSGLVRMLGVSNFSPEEMTAAQAAIPYRLIANQIEYNLLVREHGRQSERISSQIIPYCRENGMLVIAYSPLAKGLLAKPGIAALDTIAAKHAKTPAQVALNWIISQHGIITIPRTASKAHMLENIGALRWHLPEEDIAYLTENVAHD